MISSYFIFDNLLYYRQLLAAVNQFGEDLVIFSMNLSNFTNQWKSIKTNIIGVKVGNFGKLAIYNGVLMYLTFAQTEGNIGYYIRNASSLAQWHKIDTLKSTSDYIAPTSLSMFGCYDEYWSSNFFSLISYE